MAVPRGDNGLMEEDEVDALIEENGVDYESDPELSSNLRDLAAAAQSGDVIALRNAIGTSFLLLKLSCRPFWSNFSFLVSQFNCVVI